MSRRFPPAFHEFARANAGLHSVAEMAALAEREFGIPFTYSQIKNYYKNHGLRAKPLKGRKGRSKFPEGTERTARAAAPGGPGAVAAAVNARFGEGTMTEAQARGYMKNHGMGSGRDSRFKPGRVPHNKGRKWEEWMPKGSAERCRATQFKKGRTPWNGGAPIGTLCRMSSGYWWEKVAQPGTWAPKHRLEWERANGPVPEGMLVCFADGDKSNWKPGNLYLESRARQAVKNLCGIRGWDRESQEAAGALAGLKISIKAARKRGKGGAG